MATHDSSVKDARGQAVYWVGRLNDSSQALSAAELEEFHGWLLRDARHEQEFLAVNNIAVTATDLPAAERARLSALAAETAAENLRAGVSTRRQFLKWSALAASVVAAIVLGGYFVQSQGWFGETYATRTGETRVVTFREGSVAYLNTRTEVRWLGGGHDRRVALVEGEALFDVVHDPQRPFRVLLDNSEIQVLGTRFNIYRKNSGEVIVTVLEGTVEVREFGQKHGGGDGRPQWKRLLHANQQIEYRPIGLMREPHDTVAVNAVKWRSGVLKIEDEALPNVLDELTRYTDERILIRDPRLAQIRVGGAFSTRNVGATLARLAEIAPIEVMEKDGTFTLDYRPADGAPQQPQ